MKEILVKLLMILASEESDSKVCLFCLRWIEITDSIGDYCCRGYRSRTVGWTFVLSDHPGVEIYSINSFCLVVGSSHGDDVTEQCLFSVWLMFLMLFADYETCLWNKRLLRFGKLVERKMKDKSDVLFQSGISELKFWGQFFQQFEGQRFGH